jgi:hypothetical protein
LTNTTRWRLHEHDRLPISRPLCAAFLSNMNMMIIMFEPGSSLYFPTRTPS